MCDNMLLPQVSFNTQVTLAFNTPHGTNSEHGVSEIGEGAFGKIFKIQY